MKKIFTFLLFLYLFSFIQNVDANWYGNTGVPYSNTSLNTSCPSDGDTTGGTPVGYPGDIAVTNSSSSLTPNPVYNNYSLNSNQTNAIDVSESGTMYCLKWDASKPTNPTSLTYTIKNSDGTNCNSYAGVNYCKTSTVNITANWSGAGDQGGSGIKDYDFVVFNSSNGAVINQTDVDGNTRNFNINLSNGTRYGIKIKTRDNALNLNDNYFISSTNFFIDTTSPNPDDLILTTPNDLLAINNHNYTFSITDGGSQINLIKFEYENYDNPNTYTNLQENNNSGNFSWNISKVDNNRLSNGSRTYKINFTQICDAAGNCYNGNYERSYNVYSNTQNINSDIITENLSNNDNIADGSIKNLNINLEDNFGNIIIPSSGIGRNINFSFNNVENTMYLDQYTRTGGTSIFATNTANGTIFNQYYTIGTNNYDFDNQTSNDGNYIYNFKSYTPTFISEQKTISDPDAKFIIGSINMSITGSIGSRGNYTINPSSISLVSKPLFETEYDGDLVGNGFIAQANQQTDLNLTKNSIQSISNSKLFLRFGGEAQTISKYDLKNNGNNISENSNLTTELIFTNNNELNTYLELINPPAPSSTKAYLSSHIMYTIDGVVVTTNSGIIGKLSYHQGYDDLGANQSGLKIIGNIYSQNGVEQVIDGQNLTSIGKIEKLDIKTDLISQAFEFAKEVSYSSVTDGIQIRNIGGDTGGGKRVGNVIYMGNIDGTSSPTYQLGNGSSDINVNSTKTILVIGGNLHIKSNMYYSGDYNLGIVVLKDKNGNGGNIYIDPSVTNIVGTIFAEKALISYNGSELDGNTNAEILKNQLHIYGSVFSFNTMGGSAKSTPECPFYFTGICTKTESQKYDLNYLRRFYVYTDINGKQIGHGGKVSGGGNCTDGVCTGGNSNYKLNITNLSDPLSEYPIIIEYNPSIQTKIPPFFNSRQK